MHDYHLDSFGQLTYHRPVRVDSDIFGEDVYGHVSSIDPSGSLHVRVEEPTTPTRESFEADFPDGPSYDQAEFVDAVHHSAVRDAETGETLPDPRPALEERARRRRVAAMRQDPALRRRALGSSLSELDASRREGASALAERMSGDSPFFGRR